MSDDERRNNKNVLWLTQHRAHKRVYVANKRQKYKQLTFENRLNANVCGSAIVSHIMYKRQHIDSVVGHNIKSVNNCFAADYEKVSSKHRST